MKRLNLEESAMMDEEGQARLRLAAPWVTEYYLFGVSICFK
jgi:hypothetical protein